jgi:hypothetical protein
MSIMDTAENFISYVSTLNLERKQGLISYLPRIALPVALMEYSAMSRPTHFLLKM